MPFVWSDQYDRKIQTVGHFRGDDDMEVVYGTLEERRFVVGVRAQRPAGRRARIFHAGQGHAVSEDDRGAGHVRGGRRARPRVVRRRTVRHAIRGTTAHPSLRDRGRSRGSATSSALGAMLPVMPALRRQALGGNDVAVGLAVGAIAVGAILLRPIAGRIGDRFGRRVLMVGGAFIVGITAACAGLVPALEWLIATRLRHGARGGVLLRRRHDHGHRSRARGAPRARR